MTKGNLIKAARIGYLEAQQRLDWDLGDRVHYYDATSSFYDEYSNIIPVDIDIDGFYYENKIEINGDRVLSGIVIPKVDTTIDPARNTPMIDRENGMRYELTIDPAWTAEQCENKVSGFICDAYTEHVGGAMNYTHQGAEYNKIHDAVMSGIIEGRADESGENRYNIYDFAAKDLGGKLQYTWELRIGTENHNMCVWNMTRRPIPRALLRNVWMLKTTSFVNSAWAHLTRRNSTPNWNSYLAISLWSTTRSNMRKQQSC